MIRLKQPHGQAIVFIVLAIVGLFALTALAIDGGNAFADRRRAQSAADNAALAGAYAGTIGGNMTTAALQITRLDNRPDAWVTVQNPPGTRCNGTQSPLAGNVNYIQVIIRSTVPTYFGSVIGINTLEHCVEATSRFKIEEPGNAFPGQAIITLDCGENRAFNAHGTAVLHVTGGGVFVNSNDSNDALYAGGTPQVWAPHYDVVGGTDGNGNLYTEDGTDPGIIHGGMLPYACPIDLGIPTPVCIGNVGKSVDAVTGITTFTPNGTQTYTRAGVMYTYTSGNIRGRDMDGNITLNPGVYCISGDVKLTNDDILRGSDVLLYFENGAMDMSGQSHIELTGYPNDPWAKMLVYAPIDNNSEFKWNGDSLSTFVGSIVVPGAHFNLLGTGAQNGMITQIIANTAEWGGTGEGFIVFDENGAFEPVLPPEIELVH